MFNTVYKYRKDSFRTLQPRRKKIVRSGELSESNGRALPAVFVVHRAGDSIGRRWMGKRKRGKRTKGRGKEKKSAGGDACAAAVTAAATVAFVPSANGTRCQSSLSRAPRRWPQFTKRRPRDSRRASRSSSWLRGCREAFRGYHETKTRRVPRVHLCAILSDQTRADFSRFHFVSFRFTLLLFPRDSIFDEVSIAETVLVITDIGKRKSMHRVRYRFAFRVINSFWKLQLKLRESSWRAVCVVARL